MNRETLALKFKLAPPFGSLGLRSVRKTVSFLAGQWGFDEESRNGIALALSEALNNAREHVTVAENRIEITCYLGERSIKLIVEDFGNDSSLDLARAFDSRDVPTTDSERGRGVFLMRSLMDEVTLKRKKEGGVAVVMLKRCP